MTSCYFGAFPPPPPPVMLFYASFNIEPPTPPPLWHDVIYGRPLTLGLILNPGKPAISGFPLKLDQFYCLKSNPICITS